MDDCESGHAPVNLAYKLYQPANGQILKPPVIFLHGMSISKEYWQNLPEIVAEKSSRKVYNVDARHHGESDWKGPFHFDANVDDLIHFMESHDIETAALVGHSMGGITAYKMALRNPSKIEKVCAVDIAVSNNVPSFVQYAFADRFEIMRAACKAAPKTAGVEEGHQLILQYIQKNGTDELKQSMTPDNSYGRYRMSSIKRGEDGAFSLPFNVDAVVAALRGSKLLRRDFAGMYEGPVLVVVGGKSSLKVEKYESEIKALFPSAQLMIVEDASHYIPSDCPEQFQEILLKFLIEE